MKKRITDWDSVGVEQYFYDCTAAEQKALHEELRAMMSAAHKEKPVQWHKARLGQQDYTYFNGEFRFWVWESRETSLGTSLRWRMLANNEKGCCFELEDKLTHTQVRAAWDDYRKRTLLLQLVPGTRVLCYAKNEPGVIVGPCPRYPDSYRVLLDDGKKDYSITIGNIAEAP
jgi:hypothetical protein